MTIKLRRLPSTGIVKISISVSEALKGQIDRYAQLHSQTWGTQVNASALIPYIVETFLSTDLAFRKSERLRESRLVAARSTCTDQSKD